MMATALGQRFNAVRDVRRTFRAGLWLIVIAMPPYWLLLWHVGALMRAFGISAELASQGQTFLRAYMWCAAPWLLFQLLRNFVVGARAAAGRAVAEPRRHRASTRCSAGR